MGDKTLTHGALDEQCSSLPWWRDGTEIGTIPKMDTKVANVSGATHGEAVANAKFIVRACNAHTALLNACIAACADDADSVVEGIPALLDTTKRQLLNAITLAEGTGDTPWPGAKDC